MHKLALFISVLLVLAGCQQSTKSVSPAAEVFSLVQPDDRSHLSVIMDTAAAIHLERRVGIGSPKYRVDRLIGKTRAEAIEIIARGTKETSKVVGRQISQIKLPPGVTIGAVIRDDEVLIAHDKTVIETDDHIVMFLVDKKFITEVEKLSDRQRASFERFKEEEEARRRASLGKE